MATLEAVIGSTVYSLSNGQPFEWVGEDGWGMAPVTRIEERGPAQHGTSDIDFRLQARQARLVLLANARTADTHWSARDQLLQIFRPTRTPIGLRWTKNNGAVRVFDVHYAGDLSFGSGDRIGYSQRMVVELRAANPTCYNPDRKFVTFGIAVTAATFGFPQGFAVSFGEASTISTTKTIAYAGTWREYPVIEIVGPLTNPVITNLATGDILDLTGTTITAGNTYTIDCRPGYKTVKDAAGVNRIAALSDASDLATFSLEAAPDVAAGLNDIKVTGTAATAATQVYLRYYERYLGI